MSTPQTAARATRECSGRTGAEIARPRQNRVTPFSELIADPARGLVYGNRGVLHNARGEIRRRAGTTRWITCQLSFKGRHRTSLMAPGRYTELFFLDEATAFAAGHRPCAECRREDYRSFLQLTGTGVAGEIDARLQAERLTAGGSQRHHVEDFAALPDGVFVLRDGGAWLLRGGRLRRWTAAGYTDTQALPDGPAEVITPESMLSVLATGWSGLVPLLHPSAGS
jgi:hypothetical protein